ncbi:MAG: RidA family protein [Planctomycetota bacterium]
MSDVEARLRSLNLTLPEPVAPLASYVPAVSVHAGALVLISGQIPTKDGAIMATGRVPSEVSEQLATECARQCVVNALASLKAEVGDLQRVRRVVKLGIFVACDPGFGNQPEVGNGASDLIGEIFGDNGRHARAAVGVPALPRNVPVEIDFTFCVD